MCTGPSGRKYAEQVQCARVYHINVVLRIRTSTQDRVSDRAYKEKSMQIQRYAAVMSVDQRQVTECRSVWCRILIYVLSMSSW